MDSTGNTTNSTIQGQQSSNTDQAPSTANPQSINPQARSLQNASPQSVEQIRALDQSSQALQVSGTSQAISLSDIAVTGSTAVQPPATTSTTTQIGLYVGLGLVVVVFLAILVHGLFKPRHTT